MSWTKEAFDNGVIEIPWLQTKDFFGNAPLQASISKLLRKNH